MHESECARKGDRIRDDILFTYCVLFYIVDKYINKKELCMCLHVKTNIHHHHTTTTTTTEYTRIPGCDTKWVRMDDVPHFEAPMNKKLGKHRKL
jgi:hypothetical protein